MERLLTLRIPVYSVIYDTSVTKVAYRAGLDISDANWNAMETITPLLKPFADATEFLRKEDIPTGSDVYVLLHDLIVNH